MIKKLFSSQLRINMISGVAVTTINMAVLAIAYPIYLHFLGYERYGVWLVLSVVLSFAQLGNLGVNQAVMKLVAEEYGREDLDAAGQYMASAIVILMASGLAVLSLILLLKGQIVAIFRLSEESAEVALWLLPYMACLSVYVFIVQAINAALSGFGRMDLANYAQTGGRLIAVLLAAVLLALGAGIEALLLGSAASYVFIHLVSLVLIRRVVPIRIMRSENFNVSRTKRLLHFGSGMFGSSVLSMLLSPFNKLMLSRYAGVATIPVYEIAYTGSMQVRALAEAGIRALMPEVSRLGANMTRQASTRIREVNRRAVGLVVRFAVPFYMAIFLTTPLLLRVWLRERFTEALPPAFQVALIASLLSLACVPAYYLLLGLGRVRHCVMGHAILTGVNAIFVIVFAWTDAHLSLREVLASLSVATLISSVYVILQSKRVLRAARLAVSELPDSEEELSNCQQERSLASTCQ